MPVTFTGDFQIDAWIQIINSNIIHVIDMFIIYNSIYTIVPLFTLNQQFCTNWPYSSELYKSTFMTFYEQHLISWLFRDWKIKSSILIIRGKPAYSISLLRVTKTNTALLPKSYSYGNVQCSLYLRQNLCCQLFCYKWTNFFKFGINREKDNRIFRVNLKNWR